MNTDQHKSVYICVDPTRVGSIICVNPCLMNNKQKHCYFCLYGFKEIDYKDIELLRRFISSYEKILPGKRKGTCAKHQRKLSQAIKRARFMALVPYVRQ